MTYWRLIYSSKFLNMTGVFICQVVYDYQSAYSVAKRYIEQVIAPKKGFLLLKIQCTPPCSKSQKNFYR